MSLHHFYWRGKERTVSVDKRRKDIVLLRFIDEEIIELTGNNILQVSRQQPVPDEASPAAVEIITAVKEAGGL